MVTVLSVLSPLIRHQGGYRAPLHAGARDWPTRFDQQSGMAAWGGEVMSRAATKAFRWFAKSTKRKLIILRVPGNLYSADSVASFSICLGAASHLRGNASVWRPF